MIFQCFIEGKAPPFLKHGQSYWAARKKAILFLEAWGLPTEGLRMKRYREKPGSTLKRNVVTNGQAR